MPSGTDEILKAIVAHNQGLADWSTLVVFLGLVGEIVVIFLFTKDKPRWEIILSFLAAAIIACGVYGEYRFSSRAAQANSELRRLSEQQLAHVTIDVGNTRTAAKNAAADAFKAKESAKQANDLARAARREADSFEKDIKSAKEHAAAAESHLAESLQRAASAESHLAEADERAARAEQMATEERLARHRIEEQLAGWKLDAEGQARLIHALEPDKGTSFWLSTNPSEVTFMETLDGILIAAGWVRQQPEKVNPLVNIVLDGKSAVWYGSGMHLEIARSESDPLIRSAADALLKNLISEGIPAEAHAVTQGLNSGAIHIAIGKR